MDVLYRAFVRARVRRGFRQVSNGELDALVSQFAPDAVFAFPGDHAMAGELHGPRAIREWFR